MSDYLTMADVLALHADQVQRFGGSQGLRDAAFSKQGYSVRKPDIIRM